MGGEWKELSLGEFVTLQRGHDLPATRRIKGEIPILGSFGITGWHNEAKVEGPGVTVGRSGASFGTVSYSPINYWPLNTALYVKDFHGNDPKFAFYFLRSLNFKRYNSGSAQPSLNRNHIHPIPIIIPPLPEQKAIAHILGSLDDKIELNRQMSTTLEAMAQALFKSWFVDFDPVLDKALAAGNSIPEPFRKRAEVRKDLGDRRKTLPADIAQYFPDSFIFNEEMGWVPEGWEVMPLSQAININPRVPLKKGVIAKYVDMKALPTSGYSIDVLIEKEYSGGAKYENGDVLLARITPCLENGKTGIVDFLKENEIGFGSTEFVVLRGKDTIKTPFIAALSRDEVFRKHCTTSMVGSSGRQRVQKFAFDSYFLCKPDKEAILNEYHRLCSVKFDMITVRKNEINSLATLRDTLLPKLLTGQLRIPDAEQMILEN